MAMLKKCLKESIQALERALAVEAQAARLQEDPKQPVNYLSNVDICFPETKLSVLLLKRLLHLGRDIPHTGPTGQRCHSGSVQVQKDEESCVRWTMIQMLTCKLPNEWHIQR